MRGVVNQTHSVCRTHSLGYERRAQMPSAKSSLRKYYLLPPLS